MTKICILTAYDFNTARALAEAGIDYVLVGDSLAMVGLGYANTTLVSVDEMLMCTRAVRRGASLIKEGTKIIVDLPFQTVSKQISEIIIDAQKFITAGANIVKIENAEEKTLNIIKELRKLNIEVMGHIGYTPQDVEKFAKSKIIRDREKLLKEAKKLETAGVMGMVLEMVPAGIAKEITETISVPTIGIGSGPHTGGQVLVTDDMLGRYNLFKPKFLRRYAEQYTESVSAVKQYINDVRDSGYPSEDEFYT